MPNIASVLKGEIARVARKEVRGETRNLKSSSTQYRSDIVALKRRVLALERQLKGLSKAAARKSLAITPVDPASTLRFSAKGLATKRRRLGLSAADMAALLGVSAQSIYKWEEGKARPRTSQLPAIAAVRSMEQRIAALQEDLRRLHPEASFDSHHPPMLRALDLARQAAPTEAIVLLRGPSGTGKSVLARAIHEWSRRKDKPMGVVACASLSPELLESELFGHVKGAFTGAVRDNRGRVAACEGGTLFLDEIGDLPLPIQPKLLRFLQDREYERVGDAVPRKADVRILAATNADLAAAVKEGRFREDLFYRFNVFPIDLPPLRERTEDIEALATRMLEFFGAQNHKFLRGFSDEAVQAIKSYTWPGNLRELRNVIERAAILCASDIVGIEHLPEALAPRPQAVRLGDPVGLDAIEEAHIRRVLASTKSLQEAADILGIDQATLWRKRKQYGI